MLGLSLLGSKVFFSRRFEENFWYTAVGMSHVLKVFGVSLS